MTFIERFDEIKKIYSVLVPNSSTNFNDLDRIIKENGSRYLIPVFTVIVESLKTEIAEYLQNLGGGSSFGGGGGSNIPLHPPAPALIRSTGISIKEIKLRLQQFYNHKLGNLNGESSVELLFKLCKILSSGR